MDKGVGLMGFFEPAKCEVCGTRIRHWVTRYVIYITNPKSKDPGVYTVHPECLDKLEFDYK